MLLIRIKSEVYFTMKRLPLFIRIIICFVIANANCKFRGYPSLTYSNNSILQYVKTSTTFTINTLRRTFGGDLPTAVYDMVEGFPLNELAIAYDNHTDYEVIEVLTSKLRLQNISIYLYNLTTVEIQEAYFRLLQSKVDDYGECYTVFFCTHRMYEHILLEVYDRNYIRRNLIYIFVWGRETISTYFTQNIKDAMNVFVVTNPREDTFRLYFNQSPSHRRHHLTLVNWWHHGVGLFHHPTLPHAKEIYKDFKGKVFNIPVIHKPPWHFVEYDNDSIQVHGGRDDRILHLLSRKLNFRYKYFDPPDRIQGSAVSANGSFEGVLGLVWKRKAEFFIGDVALTLERSQVVEFSFLTLADSGAFVTHAPSRLNEALALLRPFQWQVWPAILVTLVVSGPILYLVIAVPNLWQPRFLVRSHGRLFFDCAWFTTTIILRQTGREPSRSHKARFVIILLSISATYVIGDMYSANLTSLLARPGRERAISTLSQLEEAMLNRGYNLYVERHSSTYSLLENGTGIYGRLWDMMTKWQQSYLVESVEEGVKLVRDSGRIAVIAGRETLFFDIQRFGPNNFHISEKLNTAYSAIAFQLGCPYIEHINRILMGIFEAGILTKMTENEYEKLGKQQQVDITSETDNAVVPGAKKETRRAAKATEDSEKLRPISLKMLQGAFYLLLIGHAASGLILVAECLVHKHQKQNFYYRKKAKRHSIFKKWLIATKAFLCRIYFLVKQRFRRIMHDAYVATLEYIE